MHRHRSDIVAAVRRAPSPMVMVMVVMPAMVMVPVTPPPVVGIVSVVPRVPTPMMVMPMAVRPVMVMVPVAPVHLLHQPFGRAFRSDA